MEELEVTLCWQVLHCGSCFVFILDVALNLTHREESHFIVRRHKSSNQRQHTPCDFTARVFSTMYHIWWEKSLFLAEKQLQKVPLSSFKHLTLNIINLQQCSQSLRFLQTLKTKTWTSGIFLESLTVHLWFRPHIYPLYFFSMPSFISAPQLPAQSYLMLDNITPFPAHTEVWCEVAMRSARNEAVGSDWEHTTDSTISILWFLYQGIALEQTLLKIRVGESSWREQLLSQAEGQQAQKSWCLCLQSKKNPINLVHNIKILQKIG